MYISSYSPIQSSYGGLGSQGLYSGGFGYPIQQAFSAGPMMYPPLQSGSFSVPPYNVVSYGFAPSFQSGSYMPQYGGFIPSQGSGMMGRQQFSSGIPHTFASGYGIASSTGIVQPSIELAETNNDLVLTCELPNVNPNDVNLTVTDDSISISTVAHDSSGLSTPVHRTVCLPTSIKSERVNASFSNGILEARLPKSDISARRRIKVNPTI
ncbi:MAG: Hsp20 family protein [Clostridia bacterium]|nr:Hsp20 family protein [Clostridia bacterium]